MSEKAPNDRFWAKYDFYQMLLNTFLDQKFYKLPKSKIWKKKKNYKKKKKKTEQNKNKTKQKKKSVLT